MIVVQFILAYLVRDWSWWSLAIVSYVLSGTLNQNLFCAQHEISHCLAFRKPSHNKLLALAANLPLVVPIAVKFREYHHDHHLFLGVDGGDVDLPTPLEAQWINNTLAKIVYGFFYLVVYGVRPLIVRPKAAGIADLVNFVTVMGCNGAVLYFWGIKSLVYLFAGSILGGGLHPLAGHLIAEHYMFEEGQETYSYYGPLNVLSYNVGYHNEHHDFPQIPQTRLYKLRAIAPEYYEHLYQHTSWCRVIWNFLFDPSMGPWSRMHRVLRDGTPEGNAKFISGRCAYGTKFASTSSSTWKKSDSVAHTDMERKSSSASAQDRFRSDSAGEEEVDDAVHGERRAHKTTSASLKQKLSKEASAKLVNTVHLRNDSAVETNTTTTS